ncbi:MAG: ECF-type sigma factor, partial [Planctomycetota bacterium]
RAHFHRVAARAMRRILIDWARRMRQLKRGGGRIRVPLEESTIGAETADADLLDLAEALERLHALNSRWAAVVELRFLSGMTCQEVADVLGVSVRTVEADWQFARTWLHRELTTDP